MKSDFILSLCELIIGGKSGLEPVEKTIIDRCERFQALLRPYSELSTIEEENIFSYGFTLGLLLMMDVTKESETIRNE